MTNYRFRIIAITLLLFSSVFAFSQDPTKKIFGFDDAMKFNEMRRESISDSGNYFAYQLWPPRGDGAAYIQKTDSSKKIIKIERGTSPVVAKNEQWAAAYLRGKAIDYENADSPSDNPKTDMAILDLNTEERTNVKDVKKFEFSEDGNWIAIYHNEGSGGKAKLDKKPLGKTLRLKHLNSGTDLIMEDVIEYMFDSNSVYLFYSVASPSGEEDGVYFRELLKPFAPIKKIDNDTNYHFANLAWNYSKKMLAFTKTKLTDNGYPYTSALKLWGEGNDSAKTYIEYDKAPEEWYIPAKNELEWTRNGDRLYLGLKPYHELDTIEVKKEDFTDSTFYSMNNILDDADIKVWHWNDPLISSNRVIEWNKDKDRIYRAVFHLNSQKLVQLADEEINDVKISQGRDYTIGYSQNPYMKEITYKGWFFDLYKINIQTGEKTLIEKEIEENAHISPEARWILYYKDKNWFIHSTYGDSTRDLTSRFEGLPFWDEEHDIPANPPSYGFGGWFEGGDFCLIYDKYDIWRFSTDGQSNVLNMTNGYGRSNNIKCRMYANNLEENHHFYTIKDTVYINMYSETEKWYRPAIIEFPIMGPVIPEYDFAANKNYYIKGRAQNANKLMFSRESFDEFPDLWIGTPYFEEVEKITNANPQIKEYTWGKSKPLQFTTKNEDTLDAYIILPDNFDPNKKYPMLVYFYEQFSFRTYSFYQPRINHRPIYQSYLGDGYLVLVPDMKYYEGRPGFDATDALTGAVQSVIDSGWVNKDKIALQGHSWGAYQAAHVISQTDIFVAACAGAPVGNMTSAYSGIRLGTGLARQFQYEKYQSRIGGNLWDSLDAYIANSPVFQAPKINTPLLIMHGNQDEAVPWEQGIETFLALRRLDKPAILIEYEGEMHHPRKFRNQLDWSVKMKEWFDHYCLGIEAADWIKEGLYYKGDLTPKNKTIYHKNE